MEKILHQLIWFISHYSQGFIHVRWCRISSINSSWNWSEHGKKTQIIREIPSTKKGFQRCQGSGFCCLNGLTHQDVKTTYHPGTKPPSIYKWQPLNSIGEFQFLKVFREMVANGHSKSLLGDLRLPPRGWNLIQSIKKSPWLATCQVCMAGLMNLWSKNLAPRFYKK